jgi:hypothetical protein
LKFVYVLLVVSIIALAVGCSSRSFESRLNVESTLNPDGNYGTYKTFGWVNYNSDQVIIRDPQVRARVVEAIEQEFTSRGLTYDAQSPDLMVGYHGAVEQKLDEEQLGAYYDESSMQLDSDAKFNKIDTWDVGTLVLMIFEAKTGMMLWQASAQAELDERASESDKKKNIEAAVRAMLDTLPTSKDIDKVKKEKN